MNKKNILYRISFLYSTFFYIGCIPVAPGTVSSLLACFIASIFFNSLQYITYNIFLYFFIWFILSICVVYYIEDSFFLKIDDPRIVIDEIYAVFIIYLTIEYLSLKYNDLLTNIIIFVAFRFFDIVKPLGIFYTQRISYSIGVFLDDILAAIYTVIVLIIYKNLI